MSAPGTGAAPTPSGASSPPPPPTTAAESALIGAAQEALAAELQAVWGYPVLGPRLTDAAQTALARSCDDEHTATVDALRVTLASLGRTPVAPAADYPLPSPVADPAQAAAYAVELERACAAGWRFVLVRGGDGTDVGGLKATAVDALAASAVRAARWSAVAAPTAPTVAFPGT